MFNIMTALVTPFQEDGSIDFLALQGIIQEQLHNGVDGFIVCGTTAEAPTLREEEKFSILAFVLEQTKHEVSIWFGCGSNDTQATVSLCKKAQEYDIDGVLLVTPYYNKPSQEGLYKHYKSIASQIQMNIMLYDVPSRTGVQLEWSTTDRLLQECSNIVALKHASHDLTGIQRLHKKYPHFQIYSGEDNYFMEGKKAGMCGIISVMSHIHLKKMRECIEKQDQDLLEKLVRSAAYVFIGGSPVTLKYILMKLNRCENIVRLPLVPLTQDLQSIVDEYMASTVFENLLS